MTVDCGPVDIRATMDAAAEGVQDRLTQSDISLNIRVAPDIGSFVADELRVRQTLFNLLANAIGFSTAGETVTLAAQRLKDAVVFSVTDPAPGIGGGGGDRVLVWWEPLSRGPRRRGPGRGWAVVRSWGGLRGGGVPLAWGAGGGPPGPCFSPRGGGAEPPA